VHDVVADYGPIIGLAGVAVTLYINGAREERQRRRENHSRAIRAVVAYAEMPFRIRRRRHEEEHASAERTRLSDDFSAAQVELAACEALIRADRDIEVRDAYERLVSTTRSTAGTLGRDAWSADPITCDSEMNMPDVAAALAPVRQEQEACEAVMAGSTRPWAKSTST
jgi:hypothetical protein